MRILDLNEIKNRIYEAEGLLELCGQRPEKAEALTPLIRDRVVEVLRLIDAEPETDSVYSECETVSRTAEAKHVATTVNAQPSVPASSPEPEVEIAAEPVAKVGIFAKTLPEVDAVAEKKKVEGPLFCLNDRFKFRRVLFGGSEADFDEAVNHISSMNSYAEAERYLIEELGMNLDSEEGEDFLAVIRSYYGE